MLDLAVRTTFAAITLAGALAAAQPASAQDSGATPMVSIPLHDISGTVRAYMTYRRNPDGATQINFVDAESRSQLNAISAQAGGATGNALSGLPPFPPLADLPEVNTGCGTGSSGGRPRPAGRLQRETAIGQTAGAAANPGGAPQVGIICNASSDVALLQVQVNQLRTRLQQVTDRLDAAARR